MSNRYVNRNRSQGDYAMTAFKQKNEPIFFTPDKTWLQRAEIEKQKMN